MRSWTTEGRFGPDPKASLSTVGAGRRPNCSGKAGQRRDVSLIDYTVSQPERIDFVARPKLENGLERCPPAPAFIGEGILKTPKTAVKPYAKWKRSYEPFQKAWKAAEPESRKRSTVTAGEFGVASPVVWKAVEHGVLEPDFPVTLRRGHKVTVREILADPEKYHGKDIPDPLEPTYDGGRLVAAIYTDGLPHIWSFAHGGRALRMLDDYTRFYDDPSLYT